MEPPQWPAVSNMGSSHTERDSMEVDQNRLNENKNSNNNSNNANH